MADLEAAVRRYVDAIRAKDVEAIVSMFAPDGVRMYGGVVTKGRESIRRMYETLGGALDTKEFHIERILVCGDSTAITEYHEVYSQVAPIPTPFGVMQPSNTPLDVRGVSITEFEGELIKEHRVYSDGAFQMLGHSPAVVKH